MTTLFSNNRSMVKLIQTYKRQLDPTNQPPITTDQLIQLLIQLIQMYLGFDQDISEEEIVEILQNYTSLSDLITQCLSEN